MFTVETGFCTYIESFCDTEKRSMFGGTGYFIDGAMFALYKEDRIYIRGGDKLTDTLKKLSCKKFVHVKKSTSAVINYFDITELFNGSHESLKDLISESINIARTAKAEVSAKSNLRLRDLPNLRLTIERMLKKSGIADVDTFYALKPEEVYRKVQASHGYEVDIKLLWMFAGAQKGCHWTLLDEKDKQELLKAV